MRQVELTTSDVAHLVREARREVVPPAGFANAVSARLRAEARPAWRRALDRLALPPALWRPALAVGAMACLAAALMVALKPGLPKAPAVPAVAPSPAPALAAKPAAPRHAAPAASKAQAARPQAPAAAQAPATQAAPAIDLAAQYASHPMPDLNRRPSSRVALTPPAVQAAAAPEAAQRALPVEVQAAPQQGMAAAAPAVGSAPAASAASAAQVSAASAPQAKAVTLADNPMTVVVTPRPTETAPFEGNSQVRNSVFRASRGESAVILIRLSRAQAVRVDVFDRGGRRVATLQDGVMQAGVRELRWSGSGDNGTDQASGIYQVRVQAADFDERHKIAVVR